MKAIEDNPAGITRAEIVVGIPSYNEADHIAVPTGQADQGLTKYFKGRSCVIVNCDNNSPDNTRAAFMMTPTKNPKIYVSTPEGVRGKGNNLRNLFEKAVELQAKAVVAIDADLQSISPLWIRNLVEPLFEDFSYVTPLYARHKYDRIITNNIAYPLTRALYGRRVRQPIGGEFGFSGDLARIYLESDAWTDAAADYGIDKWMTTIAMLSRAPVIQSFLGRPKIHKKRDPEADLGPIFRNVVGTIFELMRRNQNFWKDVKWSRPTAVFGFGTEPEVPPTVEVDLEMLWKRFSSGVESYWDLYRDLLQGETCAKLEEVAELSKEFFEFPTALWAKVLYDFSWAYNSAIAPQDVLLDALIPLYYAKTLSFVLETETMNTQQVEEIIEDHCLQFEKTKPYLLDRWFPR
jgi:glycosyltransferase involved in cell wall biosynthesis